MYCVNPANIPPRAGLALPIALLPPRCHRLTARRCASNPFRQRLFFSRGNLLTATLLAAALLAAALLAAALLAAALLAAALLAAALF